MKKPTYIPVTPENKELWPVKNPEIENGCIILHDDVYLSQMRQFIGTDFCLENNEIVMSERTIPVEKIKAAKACSVDNHFCLLIPDILEDEDYFLFTLESREQIENKLGFKFTNLNLDIPKTTKTITGISQRL